MRFGIVIPLLLLVGCANAREQKSYSVNALAQLALESQRANAECIEAYQAKRIGKGSAEKWSGAVVHLQEWAEGICVRSNVAAPSAFEGLGQESTAKLGHVRQAKEEFCADDRRRGRFFPAAALAEPAARALFAVLLDWWRSRQETPEERDRAWVRMQEETDRACERLHEITPPVQ